MVRARQSSGSSITSRAGRPPPLSSSLAEAAADGSGSGGGGGGFGWDLVSLAFVTITHLGDVNVDEEVRPRAMVGQVHALALLIQHTGTHQL